MKGRRKIVIGGMALGLLMGCHNGIADELTAEKRLGEIGRSAEKAFCSFMSLIADTLGFRVTAETNKSEVGEHFSKLGTKLGEASDKLEEIVKKAEIGDDKSDSSKNLIRESVNAAKSTLSTLKKHLEDVKEIGDGDNGKVGEVGGVSQNGVKADEAELKKAYKALKGIVDTAVEVGVEKLKNNDITLVNKLIGGATPQNGAKVLAAGGNAGEEVGPKAAAIVSAVNGEAILDSIVKSSDNKVTTVSSATAETTPLEFAVGGEHANLSQPAAKAAAVAGGIALRSLVKNGKLASHSSNSNQEKVTVESVGMDAANKLLVAIEDVIKKTVKKVLEKAKGEIDKARETKATVQK